jgi:Protein of unknown function (DUF3147)
VRFGGNKGRILTLKAGGSLFHQCLSTSDDFPCRGGPILRVAPMTSARPSRIVRALEDNSEGEKGSSMGGRPFSDQALEEGQMTEYLIRFLVGGAVVSAFAMLGDVLRPKSFAGLFGAAPSVALATLGIAIYQHGAVYAASQSLSMMAGAIALAVFSAIVCQLLIRARMRALPATLLSMVAWLCAAFGLWVLAGGQA